MNELNAARQLILAWQLHCDDNEDAVLPRSAVCAMADGNAEVLNQAALQKMRHWANTADRPDWTVQAPGM